MIRNGQSMSNLSANWTKTGLITSSYKMKTLNRGKYGKNHYLLMTEAMKQS